MAARKAISDKKQATSKTETKKTTVKAAPKAEVKATVRKGSLTVMAFSAKGDRGTEVSLSEAIFGQKDNSQILAQAVQIYLGNQRSAQAKTKTRAEVNRTTAKVYKQKGTGGARHGSRRAPVYVGGGIAHGPTGTQNYSRTMSKALRRRALAVALSAKARAGQVVIADMEKIEAKTKNVSLALKNMNLVGKTLFVCNDNNLYKAARNIRGVNVVNAKELTAYHVLSGKNVVLTGDALTTLEGRYNPLRTKATGGQENA